jgi:hypothetical protein
MNRPVTRRTFLTSSALTVSACAVLQNAATAETSRLADPLGTVPGITGPLGLGPGTAANPARGDVLLQHGHTLVASHSSSWRIGPGKAVLLSPEPDGCWSVVYAER